MRGLTEKQSAILTFIEDFQEDAGMPPTVQEIAENFGVKSSTIFAHLRALQRKNHLARSSKARSISLSRPRIPVSRMPEGVWTVPLLGRVCAGNPAESMEYREGEIVVPQGVAGMVTPEGMFALKIQGESMRDLGIYDSDIVVVAPLVGPARPGDIVVATAQGGESTVKSYFPQINGNIELRPANPDYRTQVYLRDELTVQGRVVMLVRSY